MFPLDLRIRLLFNPPNGKAYILQGVVGPLEIIWIYQFLFPSDEVFPHPPEFFGYRAPWQATLWLQERMVH